MLSALSEGNISTATRYRFRFFLATHALGGCRSNWEVNLNPLPGPGPLPGLKIGSLPCLTRGPPLPQTLGRKLCPSRLAWALGVNEATASFPGGLQSLISSDSVGHTFSIFFFPDSLFSEFLFLEPHLGHTARQRLSLMLLGLKMVITSISMFSKISILLSP